jgi:hypothetical protein
LTGTIDLQAAPLSGKAIFVEVNHGELGQFVVERAFAGS